MEFSDTLEFDVRDRADIYEYVERYGDVDPEEARQALNMSPEAFGHHVAVLRRDGVLRRTAEDRLRIAFEDTDQEQFFIEESTEVTIRQATEDDLTRLVEAIRTALADQTYIVGKTVADIVDHENVLLRRNQLEARVFYVATIDEDVVGWVHINASALENLAHTAELTVGVIQSYRSNGIGERLLNRGESWARSHSLEKLYNSVPATNESAIEFLQARGWEVEAIRKKHYTIDDEYVDECMLAKFL